MLAIRQKWLGWGMRAMVLCGVVWSPAQAAVISGQSLGFGAEANVTALGDTAALEVGPLGQSEGSAPPPYNESTAAVELDASVDLLDGTLSLGAISGTLASTAVSDVDGELGTRTTYATALVEDFHLSLLSLILADESFLEMSASMVDSSATVTGDFGSLGTFGDSTLLDLILRVEGELVDLSGYVDAQGKAAPNTELGAGVHGVAGLSIFLNEQIETGNGVNEAGIEVNALRLGLDAVTFGEWSISGDVTLSHSDARMAAVTAIPIPGTLALLAPGLLMLMLGRRKLPESD